MIRLRDTAATADLPATSREITLTAGSPAIAREFSATAGRTELLRRIERRNFEAYSLAMYAGELRDANDYAESLVILHDLLAGLVPLGRKIQ